MARCPNTLLKKKTMKTWELSPSSGYISLGLFSPPLRGSGSTNPFCFPRSFSSLSPPRRQQRFAAPRPSPAPIQPPSEFGRGSDPTRKMNHLFQRGSFSSGRTSWFIPADAPHCVPGACSCCQVTSSPKWAAESQVLQYCDSLNSIKNMQLLKPDTPRPHALPQLPQPHSPAHPSVVRGTAPLFLAEQYTYMIETQALNNPIHLYFGSTFCWKRKKTSTLDIQQSGKWKTGV